MKDDRKKLQIQAETALHEKNYQLAVDLFSKLYLTKKSARGNFFLVQALAGLKDYSVALEFAQEYINSYLAEDERLVFYIHVTVFAGKSLKVYQLLESLKPYLTASESQLFYSTLSFEFELFEQQGIVDIAQLKKQLHYLGALEPLKQRTVAKKAAALSYQDFVVVVKDVLVDKNVHPIVRTSFLNDLRLLNVREEFDFQSFLNGKMRLIPQQLKGLEQTEAFQSYAALILGDTSRPTNLSQQILDEITLKLMILYPNFLEVEQKQDLWYHVLLNEQQFLKATESYAQIATKLEKSIAEWGPSSK